MDDPHVTDITLFVHQNFTTLVTRKAIDIFLTLTRKMRRKVGGGSWPVFPGSIGPAGWSWSTDVTRYGAGVATRSLSVTVPAVGAQAPAAGPRNIAGESRTEMTVSRGQVTLQVFNVQKLVFAQLTANDGNSMLLDVDEKVSFSQELVIAQLTLEH